MIGSQRLVIENEKDIVTLVERIIVMRIVEIEDFVHPSTGYQINVLSKYFVKFGHDVTIVCGTMEKMPRFLTDFFSVENIEEEDEQFRIDTGVKIVRVPIHKYVSGRAIYHKKIFRVVEELKPDVLFIHAEDTMIAMQYLLRVRKMKCALVMDNHQCDMSSHNKFRSIFRWGYRKVFTPIIIKYQLPIVRLTEDDSYMQQHFDIPIELTPCITFGSDTMLFHEDERVKKNFREQYGIEKEDFVIVYAGKLDEYKGGLFLANALKEKFITDKNIVFIIVGNTSGAYGAQVEKVLAESENRILRFPTQKYSELARFFQASDVCLFAKECSLTFYDAQACGLPVISENNNINIARCKHNNGINFEKLNVQDFRNKIQWITNLDEDKFEQMKKSAQKYIWDNYNYFDKAKAFEKLLIEEAERQKDRKK